MPHGAFDEIATAACPSGPMARAERGLAQIRLSNVLPDAGGDKVDLLQLNTEIGLRRI